MKLYAILSLFLLLTMLFVPLFSLLENAKSEDVPELSSPFSYSETSSARQESEKSETPSTRTEKENEKIETGGEISVLRVSSGKVETLDITDYVVCCVASEMPASYEIEALKAQAVVSFTYALYLRGTQEGADITDNSAVHQAYLSFSELKKRWGDSYDEDIGKIKKAVEEVKGEYLTYKGEIIKPPYFALSCGSTNSAEDVWGTEIAWLKSVPSEGDKLSVSIKSIFEFSEDEISAALKSYGISDITFGEAVTSKNGYVKKIDVSSHEFSGEELRELLSLRSGNFTVKKSGDLYVFTCLGYGHGVGMSQYGANCMAKEGSSYKEIIEHYYSGVEITS